jgi:hypothetical protein
MAFMNYLHEYTDYREKVEDEVEALADEYGGYYQGIWREASHYVKEEYERPDSWPWLECTGS